jgi:uncharacterized membrane protein
MNSIVIEQNDLAKKIENGLSRQTFYDWYNDDYEKFISGDENAKSEEEIIEDIKRLFNL